MSTQTLSNKFAWVIFGFLAIGVGLYPLGYAFFNSSMGLLNSKSPEILASTVWNAAFYGHISFGAFALLSGWTQFSQRLRRKYLKVHRSLGMVYLISVLVSGACSIYISFYATGGWVPGLGFFLMGVCWIGFTVLAYRAILNRKIIAHGDWMIYSYAICFSAVTLRLWLPLLVMLHEGRFIPAYKIVAYLSWIPNLFFAYFWIRRRKARLSVSS